MRVPARATSPRVPRLGNQAIVAHVEKPIRRQVEEKLRLKYEPEIIEKCDTHFYVGTVHQHPAAWIIVGLFYPPRAFPPLSPPSRPSATAAGFFAGG